MPAFRKVLAGYHNFKETTFAKNPELFKLLATKQSPKAMMIACSDSRVDPAIITNADPGDLFIVRNVANIVPPCAEAKKDLNAPWVDLTQATVHSRRQQERRPRKMTDYVLVLLSDPSWRRTQLHDDNGASGAITGHLQQIAPPPDETSARFPGRY